MEIKNHTSKKHAHVDQSASSSKLTTTTTTKYIYIKCWMEKKLSLEYKNI